jgi:hypothetical protein
LLWLQVHNDNSQQTLCITTPRQVCWNAAVVPMQHSRLWGGVSLRYTNMSDASVNSSLARQSYTVQQLLKVGALVSGLSWGVACFLICFGRYHRGSWRALLRMHLRRMTDTSAWRYFVDFIKSNSTHIERSSLYVCSERAQGHIVTRRSKRTTQKQGKCIIGLDTQTSSNHRAQARTHWQSDPLACPTPPSH